MSFISKEDLTKNIRSEELDQITRFDDTIIEYGIDSAIAELRGYLAKSYNVSLIFSQTGASRHALLLNFAIDITIYIIISTAMPGQDLEDRRARYKRAVDWLKAVQKGEIATDLPEITVLASNATSRGAYGEHVKRNNEF